MKTQHIVVCRQIALTVYKTVHPDPRCGYRAFVCGNTAFPREYAPLLAKGPNWRGPEVLGETGPGYRVLACDLLDAGISGVDTSWHFRA